MEISCGASLRYTPDIGILTRLLRKLSMPHPTQYGVEGRGFVERAEGRDVEAGLAKAEDGGSVLHGDKTDVDQLRGLLTDDVNADELQRVPANDELQKAVAVANQLASGVVRVLRMPNDVIDMVLLERFLRPC